MVASTILDIIYYLFGRVAFAVFTLGEAAFDLYADAKEKRNRAENGEEKNVVPIFTPNKIARGRAEHDREQLEYAFPIHLTAGSPKPSPDRKRPTARNILRSPRNAFGKNHTKKIMKTPNIAAMTNGAKTASTAPMIATPSSKNDNAQLDIGSGERFAPMRAAAFVPCEANAKPPPNSAAGIVMLESS